MPQPDLVELARQGDPNAIASLLRRSLPDQNLTIQVDWQGGYLNIRVLADQLPVQAELTMNLQRQLQALAGSAVSMVRVFAYRTADPTPLWSQSLSINSAIANPLDASPAAPTAIHSYYTLIPPPSDTVDRFVVCGLGSLGQYSALNLKRFAMREAKIHVTAIDRVEPTEWEVPGLLELLDHQLILGDCRDDAVLLNAGIQDSRAILIVTSNESVNIETAIAARRLNSHIRIVMRSSRQNLNQLLKQQLGDFIALEPNELPAAAFALAGLQADILGFFNIGNYRFQVVEQTVPPKDPRFDGLAAIGLHKRAYRLLSHRPADWLSPPSRAFYQWQMDTRVTAGDQITYIEVVGLLDHPATQEVTIEQPWKPLGQGILAIGRRGWRENVAQIGQWLQAQRLRQVMAIGLSLAIVLWGTGTVLFRTMLDLSWQQAISSAFILLLGGYGDVFGGLDTVDVPGWVQVVSGFISLASIASVLGVLGLITDNLLSTRFEFFRKRPAIPKTNHVVVVGFGRIGQRVATILREFRQPVVAMTERWDQSNRTMPIPLVIGNLVEELPKVNLSTAKSVVVVTDDQMLNLELALMARESAHQSNREIGLVIRTYDQRFRDNLNDLLPDVKALAAHELSAEAFAGAAFGENIIALFRLNNQTILVTEYQITAKDTLVGKLLFQIAYGYGVVPVFHQRSNQLLTDDPAEFLLPPDDRQLHVGDRLVVLASINGLRRIEHGELAPPRRWKLSAQPPLNSSFLHYCGNDLARISGCGLDEARAFMNRLPGVIELRLYDYQAHYLAQELGRQLPMTLTPIT